jgi:hypothetical protein
VRLQRHQHLGRRSKRIEGEYTEARWAVDHRDVLAAARCGVRV